MRIDIDHDRDLISAIPPGPPPGERLSGHTDRSGTTMHGWSAVAFGAIFAAVGAGILAMTALGHVKTSGDAPVWMAPVFGALFGLAGLWVIVHGVQGVAHASRTSRLREANSREPWAWDHAWNRLGSEDDSGRTIGRALTFVAFTALLLVPFNWISFYAADRRTAFQVVTGLFDVIVAGVLAWVVYLIARRMKYGVGMLRFRRFPFVVGEEVEVRLARTGPLAALEQMEATLRCVQERYEVRRSGRGKRSSRIVSYAVWSETRASEASDGRSSSAREFTWRFVVPEGQPSTSLAERPPRYWELEVKAELPGVDYRAVFLVPVYGAVGAVERGGRERLAG